MEQNPLQKTRIEVVDALRGFAVMAIILVHNLEHFIFPVYPADSPEWLEVLDQGVLNVVFSLFAGKAYAIFALLFGFTFYIQTQNQKRRGKDFGYRFLWRMVLLVGFATLNAAFFPAGDVLLLFVVVSLVLFFTRNWCDKAILIAAIIFLLQPVEWYHYLAALADPVHRLPDLKVGEMYAEVAEYTKSGFFPDGRAVPVGLLHRKKTAFCVIRKEPSSVGKDIDCFRSFLCTFIYVEGTGYGTGRYRTANRGYCI